MAPFASCEGLRLDTDERALCPPTKNRSAWPTWYVFGPPSPFLHHPLATDPSVDQVAQDFSITVIEHQPFRYLSAVSKDLASYFKPTRTTGPDADPVAIDFVFRKDSLTAYPTPAITDWIKQVDHTPRADVAIVKPTAAALIFWNRWFYFPGPLLAACLVLGFVAVIGRARRGTRRLAPEGVLYSATAFLLLLVPVATTVFDYRFLVPVFPLLGVAGALGTRVLLDRIGSTRGRGRPTFEVEEDDSEGEAHDVVPLEAVEAG